VDLVWAPLRIVGLGLRNPTAVVRIVTPYLPVFAGFIAFLVWNGGIVLGHKENHQPVTHWPQLCYFLTFGTAMLLPTLVRGGLEKTVREALFTGLGSPIRVSLTAVFFAAILAAVRQFTIWHPFLRADNRHYVFYLLRWIFLPYPWMKYAITPIYLACGWLWAWRLRRAVSLTWLLGFIAASILTLVPSPLIEPRYFLIPTIILRIQIGRARVSLPQEPDSNFSRTPTLRVKDGNSEGGSTQNTSGALVPGGPAEAPCQSHSLWIEWGWYTLINVLTIGLFLGRKFRWDGWEGWMRIMW